MDYFRRSYDSLREEAAAFLAAHHPTGTVPVPIETIVEFKLGLEVVPVAGLQEEFEVEGFLALGRQAIFVDEGIMMDRLPRYRFTLAYEAGRYLLQEAICPKSITGIPEYVRWVQDLPDAIRETSKYESYDFGGLVLVPPHHLKREFERARAMVDEQMGRRHWQLDGYMWLGICREIAPAFEVSRDVIRKRVIKDKLLPPGVKI